MKSYGELFKQSNFLKELSWEIHYIPSLVQLFQQTPCFGIFWASEVKHNEYLENEKIMKKLEVKTYDKSLAITTFMDII